MKKRIIAGCLAALVVLGGCQKAETKAPEPEAAETFEETEEKKEEETEAVLITPEETESETGDAAEKPEMTVESKGHAFDYTVENHLEETFAKDDPSVQLTSLSWDTIAINRPGCEALSETIAIWNADVENRLKNEEMVSSAEESYEEMKDYWTPMTFEDSVSVMRFDDLVFSFQADSYMYTGGAHGDTGIGGYSYKVSDGTALTYDELFTDRAAIDKKASEYLKDVLVKKYTTEDGLMMFDGWESELDNYLKEPEWLLNGYGLQYMIGYYVLGPYAMGNSIITIPYTELKGILKEEYMGSSDRFTYRFEPGETLTVDDSGNQLSALYETDYSNDTFTAKLTLQFGEEALVLDQGVEVYPVLWVVKESPDAVFVLVERKDDYEAETVTHTVYRLNGAFVQVEELQERAVTSPAEVELIVDGVQ